MSGRLIYFVQERRGKFSIQLKHQYEVHQYKKDEKYGYVLLECIDSNLSDGTLTRLNIDSGKAYLEVKSKQQKLLLNESQRVGITT